MSKCTGPTGSKGYSGCTGSKGYSGCTGFKGYSGCTGYNYIGYSGCTGSKGYSGCTGYNYIGYSGRTGMSGCTGIQYPYSTTNTSTTSTTSTPTTNTPTTNTTTICPCSQQTNPTQVSLAMNNLTVTGNAGPVHISINFGNPANLANPEHTGNTENLENIEMEEMEEIEEMEENMEEGFDKTIDVEIHPTDIHYSTFLLGGKRFHGTFPVTWAMMDYYMSLGIFGCDSCSESCINGVFAGYCVTCANERFDGYRGNGITGNNRQSQEAEAEAEAEEAQPCELLPAWPQQDSTSHFSRLGPYAATNTYLLDVDLRSIGTKEGIHPIPNLK